MDSFYKDHGNLDVTVQIPPELLHLDTIRNEKIPTRLLRYASIKWYNTYQE